jgi:putative transposase
MPRHARLRVAGHPCHVWQRGVNRCACFAGDGDRRFYLDLLAEYARKHDCAIHAYVLMTNHVHLLVTPSGLDGLSRLMKNVGERYVPRFNRAHGRTGTLWEGRFRSNLVQTESYLFTCQRYIELNPVRADLVAHPGDYRWSSYATNATGSPSNLVTPHPLYMSLGQDPQERADAYRSMFGAPTDKEIELIREAVKGGFALADKAFAYALQRETERPVTRRKQGRPRRTRDDGAMSSAPREKGVCPLFE